MKIKPINVSQIEIIPFKPKNGHLGFCSCVISDQFQLNDVALFSRSKGGIRLGYPIKTLSNGIILNIFKPLSKEVEAAIEAAVTEKYQSLIMENNGIEKEANYDFSNQR